MLQRLAIRALDELARRLPPQYQQEPPGEPRRSGPWQLYVPATNASTGALEPGAATQMAAIVLLPSRLTDAPRLLEEWRLRTVQLPASVSATTAAKPEVTLIATVLAQLRRQGDVIWTQPLEVPMTPTNAGETAFTSNFTIAELLPLDEIALRQGQTLELDVIVSFNLKVETSALLVSGWKAGSAAAPPSSATQGTLSYYTVHFTGRRTL